MSMSKVIRKVVQIANLFDGNRRRHRRRIRALRNRELLRSRLARPDLHVARRNCKTHRRMDRARRPVGQLEPKD